MADFEVKINFDAEKFAELMEQFKREHPDFLEVVRCKDCEFSIDTGMSGLYCEHPDNRNPLGCRETDFCSDGKRRDNG